MRVVIIGAGVVGYHLAEQLSGEGHEISVVDSDPALVRRLDDRFDVLAVAGDASSPAVLQRAGVENAALVVAVTNRDETNVLVSLIARKLGAKKRVVRMRNTELGKAGGVLDLEDLGADVLVNPVSTTAQLLERLVRSPAATDFAQFADGDLLLVGFVLSAESPLNGIKLKDFREKADDLHALVAGVRRKDATFVIPRGDDTLSAGDNLYVFIHRKTIKRFRELVDPGQRPVERLLISGASQLGVEVARRLENRIKNVTLVDPSTEAAEAASLLLKKTVVLRGEVGDPDFCREYDLGSVDYHLALADEDETNLLNAMLLDKEGARQTAILAQEPRYLPVLNSLDLGVTINPRLLTVSSILRHIRRGRIFQVTRVGESGAEAREYAVEKKSPMVGKALKDIDFPGGTILGAIYRGDQYMIPNGDSVLDVDDHVIIFALPHAMASVEKLFSKRRLFG
ncbi:MAG: Trk system potassium transporter TrkA [Planctomycetota bacterium]